MTWSCLMIIAGSGLSCEGGQTSYQHYEESLPGDKFLLWLHQASALSVFQLEAPGQFQLLRDHCFNFLIAKGQGSLEGLYPGQVSDQAAFDQVKR